MTERASGGSAARPPRIGIGRGGRRSGGRLRARRTAALLLLLPALGTAAWAAPPPDLRLEWPPGEEGRAISGPAGATVPVAYVLRNVGGSRAFAALLSAHTALGQVGRTERLQPGPEPSGSIERHLELALAQGMRELCVSAWLQNLRAEDPQDPNPRDNRICRRILVEDGDRKGNAQRATRRQAAAAEGSSTR